MSKVNYASDSESDEDYCIDGDNVAFGSSDDTDDSGSEASANSNNKYLKKRLVNSKPKKDPIKNVEISAPRQTRQSVASENSLRSSEKEELHSDEEADKTRSDTLWADFLSDVGSDRLIHPKTKYEEPTESTAIHVKSEALELSHSSPKQASDGLEKLLDVKKNYTAAQQGRSSPTPDVRVCVPKRPSKSSSVSAALSRFKKKKKMSVLEKSQVDWKNFKTDEGIDEELRTHNKGKYGYLERQDFLQRTDVRQFEIEKNLRQSSRQN